MGIAREKTTKNPTAELTVKVDFMDGSKGDFKGTFKRVSQDRLNELLDPEANFQNGELVDEFLVGVSGITESEGGPELPADEQLAFVKQTPECVNASVVAFFAAMRPASYDAKTSRSRRSRG